MSAIILITRRIGLIRSKTKETTNTSGVFSEVKGLTIYDHVVLVNRKKFLRSKCFNPMESFCLILINRPITETSIRIMELQHDAVIEYYE